MPILAPSRSLRCRAALLLPLLALGCVSAGAPKRVGETRVDGAVYGGSGGAGPLAWRLAGGSGLQGGEAVGRARAAQDPRQQDPETPEQRDARLRLEFGSNVLISADGAVTKQFFLAGDLAQTFLKLIAEISPEKPPIAGQQQPVPKPGLEVGGPEAKSILGRMLREHTVEVTFVPDFEVLSGAKLVEQPNKPSTAVTGEPPLLKYKDAPTVSLALVTVSYTHLTLPTILLV